MSLKTRSPGDHPVGPALKPPKKTPRGTSRCPSPPYPQLIASPNGQKTQKTIYSKYQGQDQKSTIFWLAFNPLSASIRDTQHDLLCWHPPEAEIGWEAWKRVGPCQCAPPPSATTFSSSSHPGRGPRGSPGRPPACHPRSARRSRCLCKPPAAAGCLPHSLPSTAPRQTDVSDGAGGSRHTPEEYLQMTMPRVGIAF